MAVAEHTTVVDGQIYKRGQRIWDLGSLVCVEVEGDKRHYRGLQQDATRMPHYVATGSTCLMLDTSNMYQFHKPSDTWYLL